MNRKTTIRILLVGPSEVDYVVTRRLLADLEGPRYALAWVESFEDGLRAVERGGFDLALVDEQLGPRTGIELLRIASDRAPRPVPILLLTEGRDEDNDQEALSLGVAGLIDKARLDARELDRALRCALLRERAVRDLRDHNAELLGLHRLTSLALEGTDVPSFPQAAVEELSLVTGFPIVCLEAYDRERGTLTCVGAQGLPRVRIGRPLPMAESLVADAVLRGRPLLEMGLGGGAASFFGARLGTWIALPMHADGRVSGVVTLARPNACPVDSTQINRAAALVEHLGRLCTRLADRRRAGATHPPSASSTLAPSEGGEQLVPLEHLGPAISSLRSELARRGVLVRLRDLSGARWVHGGSTPALRRHVLILLGSLLRALGPSRAELRILPAGQEPQVLGLDVTIEGLETGPGESSPALPASRLAVLRRLALRLGASLELGPSTFSTRVRLGFPLAQPLPGPAPAVQRDGRRVVR